MFVKALPVKCACLPESKIQMGHCHKGFIAGHMASRPIRFGHK